MFVVVGGGEGRELFLKAPEGEEEEVVVEVRTAGPH
jgi:hypothetical protein